MNLVPLHVRHGRHLVPEQSACSIMPPPPYGVATGIWPASLQTVHRTYPSLQPALHGSHPSLHWSQSRHPVRRNNGIRHGRTAASSMCHKPGDATTVCEHLRLTSAMLRRWKCISDGCLPPCSSGLHMLGSYLPQTPEADSSFSCNLFCLPTHLSSVEVFEHSPAPHPTHTTCGK